MKTHLYKSVELHDQLGLNKTEKGTKGIFETRAPNVLQVSFQE
jgi:hypothetical protein